MREARLHVYVTELVTNTWTGEDADVAEAVTGDEAFDVLARRLNEAGDGEPAGIATAWTDLVASLSDNDLDFLVKRADSPARVLYARV